MVNSGYPEIFLYGLALIGIPLAVYRPFTAYLLCIFLFAARNTVSANLTRTAILGPFFNLDDALILVAFVSMLSSAQHKKRKLFIPRLGGALLITWLLGTIMALYITGPLYEVFREIRWALTFPLCIILSANIITATEEVRPFLITVFWGSVIAALQHFIDVSLNFSTFLTYSLYSTIRSTSYWAPGYYIPLAETIRHYWLKGSGWNRLIKLTAIVSFIISLILSQTRSLWISVTLAFVILIAYFGRWKSFIRLLVVGTLLSVVFFSMSQLLFPALNFGNLIMDRITTLINPDDRESSTITRQNALSVEFNYWLDGNLVLGQGFGYQYGLPGNQALDPNIAFGHIGYVSYLARLGLFGLLIYGIYLPLSMFFTAKRELKTNVDDTCKQLAVLALAFIVIDSITFVMSSSYLAVSPNAGLVYGALLGIVHTRGLKTKPAFAQISANTSQALMPLRQHYDK